MVSPDIGVDELSFKIDDLRRAWGRRLLVLGHHYQTDTVLRHADAIGDSLELARRAAAETEAERIVFCGVRFMAETADILTAASQSVFLPDPEALCPMAAMADAKDAEAAWQVVTRTRGPNNWRPIVYVNSTVEVKAFCGLKGGWACTSGNAGDAFRRALEAGQRILFLPDEHLGVNTALSLGVPDSEIAIYDPAEEGGSLTPDALSSARIVVWKGYCHVHTAFMQEQITAIRRRHPGVRVIVHPECPAPVVAMADASGSTARIIGYVNDTPPGSIVAVGTEVHLVRRLAREQQGQRTVIPVSDSICPNMARNNESKLAALLEHWPSSHRVSVPETLRDAARLALDRMLAI